MGHPFFNPRTGIFAVVLATVLTLAQICTAQPSTPARPAPPASALDARAQQLYQSGRERFLAGDFNGARESFEASLSVVDSPNTRMYLGRALQRLGHNAEAWSMLDRAASDAAVRAPAEPRYAATRDSARREATALAPSISTLTVTVSPALSTVTVTVNGHPIQPAVLGSPLPIDPGEIRVDASAPGYVSTHQRITLSAGVSQHITLSLGVIEPTTALTTTSRRAVPSITPRLPVRPSLWRTVGIATAVTGAAAFAVGVGFAVISQNEYDLLLSQGSGTDAQITDGVFHRDLGNTLMFLGATTAVTGVLLWWITGRSQRESRPHTTVTAGLNGLSLTGAF